MKFAGKIKQGKLTLDDNLGFRDYLRLIEGDVHLEIKPAEKVRSNRLIDELFVFIYNGSRAEAMSGYNDDLVMSYAMGLWIRETALRLRAEGVELQKKAMNSITSNQGVYTPKNNQNDSWTMEINKKQESLDWLL